MRFSGMAFLPIVAAIGPSRRAPVKAQGMAAAIAFEEGGVRGLLHRGEAPGGPGLVLTHGAGGNCQMPLLVAAAEAFAAAGVTVLRYDLPFRQRRPTGPPSPSGAAADRAGLREAVAAMRRILTGPVFVGGQSYGGRQATMLAADEPSVADALLLFSYPLHPPGKPERLRTEHFLRLSVPALFVSGTADPFGSPDELRKAVSLIPSRTSIITVDGAGHDLKRGRFDLTAVTAAMAALIER
jgi:predicted alpha/beta-hydrolase family hydrolase